MKKQYIEQLSFWDKLDKNEKELIVSKSYEKEYLPKELIYAPWDKCLGLLIVKKGIVRLFLSSEQGKKASILRIRENEVCIATMSCIFDELDFDICFEAENNVSAVVIPPDIFNSLINKNIYIENFAYKIIAQRCNNIIRASEQLLFKSLEQRIVTFILDEANVANSDVIYLTKEQLAENIGSAREAVSRILTKLAKENLVSVKRGSIEIINKPLLYQKT